MTQNLSQSLFGPGFDAEMRTYQLLAFEQRAREKLQHNELFPSLTELTEWSNALRDLLSSKQSFENSLKSTITDVDIDSVKITYNPPRLPVHQLLETMHEWALHAQKKIQTLLNDFEEIKMRLLNDMESSPVGLLPLYRDEGYLLITHGSHTDVFIYQRKMLFESDQSLRGISSDYFSTYADSTVNTPQHIKLNLIKQHREIPNPATWSFFTQHELPLAGTLLPLAKEKLNGMIDK
jgi:hypothetical protein